ncbi:hypothetical protein GO491_05820 [Flavobacteriaceae bacterium Ap0902]|nr:hypothetical protein [Flavobacteriaceae bacterium Ap0902]
MSGVLAIRYKVNPQKRQEFEGWNKEMENKVRASTGFKDLIHINPIDENDYHQIIVRFDSNENLENWRLSDFRNKMHKESEVLWIEEKEEATHDWDSFWFDKMNNIKPWKQWVVTFFAVYPLTLIVPKGINFIDEWASMYFFKGVLSAIIISGAMNFLVMPFMMKTFKKWLHR